MGAPAILTLAGICAFEPDAAVVRARGCAGPETWAIAAPTAAAVVKGRPGGLFRGLAVDVAVSGGGFLWLGVSDEEGVRPRGLVRYDWKRDAPHVFRGTDAGPCGFHVQDLMLRDDTLWVATDLGVSRLRLSREVWDEWTHYALSADRARLEEAACVGMLSAAAEAAARSGGQDLAPWLAEFRPRFWKRHGRGTRPASR